MLGGMPFEKFLDNPWYYLTLIADPGSEYGTLAAINNPAWPRFRSEISIQPEDHRMELKILSDTAQHVLQTRAVSICEYPQEMMCDYQLH